MKNILKKSISCGLLFGSVLLFCTGCGTGTENSNVADILNTNEKKQETQTVTTAGISYSSGMTASSYQKITFEPATEAETETVFQTETTRKETTRPRKETTVTTAQTEKEVLPEEWEQAYRSFLENKEFQSQISTEVYEEDTRFLLLYLNEDDVPELFIQTTMEILFYAYHDGTVVFVDSFYPSHYTYDFYYRPYHNCLGTMQGSVMADGTYLEVYEYKNSAVSDSGFVLKETYCYPTRDYSYEIYAERGMNIDLEKAPELDIHPDREKNIGTSWLTVPDVLENSPSVGRYQLTEGALNSLFGDDGSSEKETTRKAGGNYAFG